MSGVIARASHCRIKRNHRRRRKASSGRLVHMNGRMYDYNVGRFMGVDPFIQFPLNSQSLNPYSYILNNPLSGTDPTGYASCSADASAGECAAAAGSGGTAKVTSQAEGSRIKTTVGSVTNNGNGTATVTAKGGGSQTVSLSGASTGQGTMGASSRQNQTASPSEKNATANASASNSQGGNGSNPADRFLPESMRGTRLSSGGKNDAGNYETTEPEELTRLKARYPGLSTRMNSQWDQSFEGFYRREHGFVAVESPSRDEMRYLDLKASWVWRINGMGYKDIDLKALGKLAADLGITDAWTIRVIFHTHPFDRCFNICGPDSGHFGPSYGDQSTAARKDLKGVINVVREIQGLRYRGDGKYQDLYYDGSGSKKK